MHARNSAGRVRLLVRLTAAAAAVTMITVTPVEAAPDGRWKLPALQQEKSVPVFAVEAPPLPEDPAAATVATSVGEAAWPGRSSARVALPAGAAAAADNGRAGRTPVSVRRASAVGREAGVAVTVADQDAARALGVRGVVFSLADTGGAAGDPLNVSVDYGSFRHAFGGDYATRLRLLKLPACALTTPQEKICRTAEPIATTKNDIGASTVSGQVTLSPKPSDPSVAAADSGTATVLAVSAAPNGAAGSYSASSLAPAGSWSAGGMAGDFTYSYPFRLPPPPAGSAPSVSLGYSSQSLDGRTSATNNQASWAGDGWDLSAGGFLERSYKPCSE
ncbi:MAG: hypothetical protein ACRDSQ_21275, partial [Actinokineospora sp.]